MENNNRLAEKVEGIVLMLKTIFYVVSIVYPIFGIIAGIVLQNRRFNEEVRTTGRTCFWIGVIVIAVVGMVSFFWLKSIPCAR